MCDRVRSFTIYDHPGNATLKQARPDPNQLFPGDVLFIPEKKVREAIVSTDQAHRFRVSAPRRVLRLVLEGLGGVKMPAEPCTLEIEGIGGK